MATPNNGYMHMPVKIFEKKKEIEKPAQAAKARLR